MPIQVYQKKNTLLPALQQFAQYLAPIAEQKQLATLSQGQSDIYKNVKDPIELAQVHSQYIESLNTNPDISAQNKHQLLQNANMYVGLKEGQLKEQKRVQTANTIADFMTGSVAGKKVVYKGQLVDGSVVAKDLQQLSNGDPEVYAKMVEQAAQSGAVKYDTSIGWDNKDNIVGTSGYTDQQGNPYETQTGIIREYQTKNGKVMYTDKNNNNTLDTGEQLNSRDAGELGKIQKYERNRLDDIARQRASESRYAANQNKGSVSNFALKNGDSTMGTIKQIGNAIRMYDVNGIDITDKVDTKGMARDPGNTQLAQEKEIYFRNNEVMKAEANFLDAIKSKIDIPTKDQFTYGKFENTKQIYNDVTYRQKIWDVISPIEDKVKDKEALDDTEKELYRQWHELDRLRKGLDAVQKGGQPQQNPGQVSMTLEQLRNKKQGDS